MKPYLAILKRDLTLSLGRSAQSLTTIFFFIMVASLFPFALGADPAVLKKAAAGIIWVAAVLASLLSLEALYHRDDEDGTFDLLLLSPLSPELIALAKMLAHWIASGLTLVLAGIVLSQMLFLPLSSLKTLITSLFLGTLYMSLLGGMGAVLTFGTRRPGLLLALLILPLYVPMLILGMMAMDAELASTPVKPYLMLQLALVIAALPITSLVAAACLRMNLRS